MIRHIYREEVLLGKVHAIFYQFSGGVYCEYDRATQDIVSLKINGKEVQDSDLYTMILQKYYFLSMEDCLGLTVEEVERNGKPTVAASNASTVLEEYFAAHPLVELGETPRLVIHGWRGAE